MAQRITGAKGKGGSGDKGGNRGTEVASVAYMKLLLALSEGEIAGGFTGKDIFLDGTPLLDDSGSENFPGVTWEWRSGLPDQDYIQGFPAVENEIGVSTELKYGTPWVKSITNTQLSAVRLRFKFPQGIYSMRDSGGKDAYRLDFAIDISTDGSTYKEYGTDHVEAIANTGYERSYRIDLPAATSGWQIRVRRLTQNTTDGRHADISNVESMTEIVDAKLRYPNTALLFIQFDSKLFDGKTPNVTVKAKGMVVRVPSNYDPIARNYIGNWDGTFKWSWTNNPAWIFYDLVLNKRYGLGRRIGADQVDKWTLYQIGRYCDDQVSDGRGGKEARHQCDLYLSQRADAWQVIMDLANIFQGMIGWSNNLLTLDADMPRELDPDFVFNKSNIVGSFSFSSSSEKANYSAAIITYSNPANHYNDDQASASVQRLSDRFGFNQLEMSAVGCARETEAQRRGLWAIETNSDDNAVEFKTGREGRIPRVGKIIGINNARQAGRANGGRVAAATATKITLDRLTTAAAGDRLIINLPSGQSEGRVVKSVSGHAITVETGYSETPSPESAWVLDQPDLAIQQFRVKRVAINDDGTVTIGGLPYNPNKFERIENGAVIEDRPVTVVPPRGQPAPENIRISSLYRVEQGIGITTMEVVWDSVAGAVAYEAQWRQNNGDWVNVPRTGNTRFTVDGIYAGRYTVRVRSVNGSDIASMWALSVETELTGKVGKPPLPVGLATESLVFGIGVKWGFPAGAQDTLKTEIHYSETNTGDKPLLLADVPYPSSSYQQLGLLAGKTFWYRARLVDRIGNKGDWTEWVYGQSSIDVSSITDAVLAQMQETELFKDVIKNAVEESKTVAEMAAKIAENADQLAAAVGATRETAEGIIQNALAIAEVTFRQSAQQGENSAQFEQLREVIATETEARVTDVTRLEASTAENATSITEVRQALASETEARATAVTQLTAATKTASDKADSAADAAGAATEEVAKNTAAITQLDQVVTTLDSATASRFDELMGQTSEASGGVQNTAIALIQNTLAQVSARRTLTAVNAANSAQIDRIDTVAASDREASAQSLLQMSSRVDGAVASINSVSQTVADYRQSTASQITSLTATIGGVSSAVTTNAQAVSNLNGSLNAMYSIKVGADVNGVQYAAGMGLGVQNTPAGMQSQVVFLADRFAVMSYAGSTVTLPFVIQNGQVFIRDSFIQDGTITNAKIGAFIQSNNYVPGSYGWRLDKNGTFENYGSDATGAMKQNNTTISIRDTNRLRVQIGRITGVF